MELVNNINNANTFLVVYCKLQFECCIKSLSFISFVEVTIGRP
jgi:hypothetical protein